MGDFLFGIGIAIAITTVIIVLVCLGIMALEGDSIVAKIFFILGLIVIIVGLIVGGLILGVSGINK